MKRMLGSYRRTYEERPARERDESWRYRLTPREVETLRLLHQGFTSREIAAKLGIQRKTVDVYVAQIIGKLGARNRVEAVTIALELALLGPGDPCGLAVDPAALKS
jgi:DNA-binding NarL/FixJ family response regulator